MIGYFAGAEIPGHRKLLADQNVPHVAMSYMGLRRRVKFAKPWSIAEHFADGQDVLLDSGCHTLNREGVDVTPEEIRDIAEHYDTFVAENLDRVQFYTEFDALSMGKGWIEERRSALAPEKSIVVWHEEWGVDELKRMADRHPYIAVGQGTCGDRDIIPLLRSMARSGVRFHGLGVSSPPLMLALAWASVAGTTWLSAVQHGETFVWTGTELKRYNARYKAQARKRHRTLFASLGLDVAAIEADDPTENLRLSLWSWQAQFAAIHQRHREGVTATPARVGNVTVQNGEEGVGAFAPETRNEGATAPPPERRKRLLPGIETEPFTHRYTDPESGELKTRTEHRIAVADLNVRTCDGCFLANKCPEYEPGASCVYEIPVRVKTKEQYLALLDALIAMQTQRVFFMRMSEEVDGGGYADPNLSQELDRLAKFIKVKSDIEAAGFTISMKVQQRGSAEVGLISRLFGKEAVPAALGPAAVPAEDALQSMGVLDAEVIE